MSEGARRALAIAIIFFHASTATAWGADQSLAAPADRTTFAFEDVVRIFPEKPSVARVRWNLAGIEEIRRIRIELEGKRFREFRASGELERRPQEILWRPNGPYGHLDYEVRLRHKRAADEGYDSYATKNWVVTRAGDLFPPMHVTFELDVERHPRSSSIVRFFLPDGWQSYTAMDPLGPDRFRPFLSKGKLDRPKGWIALGRLEKIERDIAGVHVTIVTPPGTPFPAKAILDLYEETLPALTDMLRAKPPRLLIVSGPDPMWHGGLSGERSLYLHAERPIRTPDRTSPALHEAFHVLAPFDPGSDSSWLTEGLAEYYSLVLQHRAGAIGEKTLRRGYRLWRENAQWDVNLTKTKGLEVTNNAAPFVLAAIDEWIRERTKGTRSLDDVVREIASVGHRQLTTGDFLRVASRVAAADLTPFVQRHVYDGEEPKLRALAARNDEEAHGSDRS